MGYGLTFNAPQILLITPNRLTQPLIQTFVLAHGSPANPCLLPTEVEATKLVGYQFAAPK